MIQEPTTSRRFEGGPKDGLVENKPAEGERHVFYGIPQVRASDFKAGIIPPPLYHHYYFMGVDGECGVYKFHDSTDSIFP